MEATLAELFGKAKRETRHKIRHDATRISADLQSVLLHVADRLFDSDFDVNALLRESKLSSTTWPSFRRELGTTPWDYISRMRIESGRMMVETTSAQFWLIASELGYDSEDVFSKRFKKYVGVLPTAARERAHVEGSPRPSVALGEGTVLDEDTAAWLSKIAERVDSLEKRIGRGEMLRFFRAGFVVRTAYLFKTLSERSRQEGRVDPQRGIELAELAVASVEGSSSALGDIGQALYARGLARLANARRLADDHEGAEREIRAAEVAVDKVPMALRPAVQAEILLNRGTLRLFQRRFTDARDDLHRSVGLCRTTRQQRLEALALIQLASMSNYVGDTETAREHLLSAHRLAEARFVQDRHLRLGFLTQLACIQAESGHSSEAIALLPEARELAAMLEHRKAEYQLDWIEAIARHSEAEATESLLRRARQGFISLRDIDHTAIVSLDLALHYEEKGRSAEVVSLAAEALPALEALQLPEASAAVRLLRRAIESNRVARRVLLTARNLLLPF